MRPPQPILRLERDATSGFLVTLFNVADRVSD